MNCDVAIIGTGPAGAAAAGYLADKGMRVLVLEQEELPRPKACGGLVPETSLQYAAKDPSGLERHRVAVRKYLYQHAQPHVSHTPDAALALVDRANFDAGAIELALAAGRGSVRLLQRFRVSDVLEQANRVVIRGRQGQSIEAQFVVAADGAASRTARCLGLNTGRVNAVGIDVEARVSAECYDRFSHQVLFDYFCLQHGYGWVFPKPAGILGIGVASWTRGVNCRAAISRFLAHALVGGELLESNSRAHPIPVYAGKTAIASSRVCLVGDAASLVDPVSGEGIRFALQSGVVAARTICDLLDATTLPEGSKRDCRLYERRVYELLGPRMDTLQAFAALPFREAPEFFYRRHIIGEHSSTYQ